MLQPVPHTIPKFLKVFFSNLQIFPAEFIPSFFCVLVLFLADLDQVPFHTLHTKLTWPKMLRPNSHSVFCITV